ncbi:hypothetical protein BH11CYA1_BH11CYA1_24670 [soil metagenome]
MKLQICLLVLLCQLLGAPVRAADPLAPAAEPASGEKIDTEKSKTDKIDTANDDTRKFGRPFTVELPSGWQVSELNAPKPNSNRELAGGRMRALKNDADGMAAIEFTYLNREDAGQANIDSEFSAFVTNIKSEYEKNGLKVSTTETKKASLGALSSSEVEITVVGQNKEMKQWFAMALGKKYVYALSYTAEKQNYDRFEPAFAKCKASLTVE